MQRVLFVVKRNLSYGHYASGGLSNSSQFIVDMLNDNGVPARLVEVTDNNDIDREVDKYRPTLVIIEALWVVPEKFEVLTTLHPKVKWAVRVHSDFPFLATEGIAVNWIFDYLKFRHVSVAFNCDKTASGFRKIVTVPNKILFLPNYYPLADAACVSAVHENIGCFGAIRPLKNQFLQAVAAIQYADEVDLCIKFHINGTRVEGGAEVLKNIEALFANSRHTLVKHPWLPRNNFLKLLKTMRWCLAVSLSETFCIAAADAVFSGVPIICSSEVPWAKVDAQVPSTSVASIVDHLKYGQRHENVRVNSLGLNEYSGHARHIWLRFTRG